MAVIAIAPRTVSAPLPAHALWGTYVFVAWTTLTTIDPITVGPLPIKPLLLLLALATWYPYRSRIRIPFTTPVLFVAIGIPIVWSFVAIWYEHPYAGYSPSPVQLMTEHAGRFVYLLIYLPLADAVLQGDGRRGLALWIGPALALCALTWVLYLLNYRLGIDVGVSFVAEEGPARSRWGPLAGVIEAYGQGVGRTAFANQIVIIPAIAVLMGLGLGLHGQSARRQRRLLLAGLLFALATLYPIHTRGITIGVFGMLVVIAILSGRIGSAWPIALLGVITALLFFGSLDPGASAFLKGDRSDLSTQQRLVQGPLLLAEWERRPLFGSGLGATLPSGYFRSASQPFSFELTYHAILFQNGIIGLALFLGVPLFAALQSLLAMRWLPRKERALAAAGAAGISGLLVACSTNPYLISTFGMLALAASIAVCARAVHLARDLREPARLNA